MNHPRPYGAFSLIRATSRRSAALIAVVVAASFLATGAAQAAPLAGPVAGLEALSSENDPQAAAVGESNQHIASVIDTFTDGYSTPYGLVLSPDDSQLYVTNETGNTVVEVNTEDGSVARTLALSSTGAGSNPTGIAISTDASTQDSTLFVNEYYPARLTVADPDGSTTPWTAGQRFTTGAGPLGVTVSPDGTRVYVANSGAQTVSVLNASTGAKIMPDITMPGGPTPSPRQIAVSPDGERLFVTLFGAGAIATFDSATGQQLGTNPISVGWQPVGIVVDATGQFIYVSNYGSNTVSILDTSKGDVPVLLPQTIDNPGGQGARNLAISPDGLYLYVPNQLTGTVSIISTVTRRAVNVIKVGSSPTSVVVSSDGRTAYVTNADSDTVSKIGIDVIDLDASEIISDDAEILADGVSTTTIRVRLVDTGGDVVYGEPDENGKISPTVYIGSEFAGISATRLECGANPPPGDDCDPDSEFGFKATLTSLARPAVSTQRFTVNGGEARGTNKVAFVAGAPSAEHSKLTAVPAPPNEVEVGSKGLAVVTLYNEFGYLVPGQVSDELVPVILTSTPGATVSDVRYDTVRGAYVADVTSADPGLVDLSFEIDRVPSLTTGTGVASMLFATGAIASSTIGAFNDSIPADGVSQTVIFVQVFNASEALIGQGIEVELATTLGTIPVTAMWFPLDDGGGLFYAPLTSVRELGVASVSYRLKNSETGEYLDGTDGTAEVEFRAGPGSALTSTITAADPQITVGGESTVLTVQIRDAYGNPAPLIPGRPLELSTTLGTVQDGPTETGNTGEFTARLVSGEDAGRAVVGIGSGEDMGTSRAYVTFMAGEIDPTRAVIQGGEKEIPADGTSPQWVQVRMFDTFGNRIEAATAEVVSIQSDQDWTAAADEPAINYNGSYYTSFRSTTAGPVVLSFTVDGVPRESTFSFDFIAGAVDPAQSTIEVDPDTIVADGVSTSTVTVTLRDAFGNVVDPSTTGASAVEIATDAGSLGGVRMNGDGTYSATLTSSNEIAVATLTYTVDDVDGAGEASVAFISSSVDLVRSTIEATPSVITADGMSTSDVRVTLRDEFGNIIVPVPTTPVRAERAVAAAMPAVEIDTDAGSLSAVTANPDGTFSAMLTSSSIAQTALLSFSVDGAPAETTASVEFAAGVASPTMSSIAAEHTVLDADGESATTITVTATDEFGNRLAVGGDVVTMSTDHGALGDVTDEADGTYRATLTSPTTLDPSVMTVSFTMNGGAGTNQATVALVPGAVDGETSTIVASPDVIVADGASTSTVTLTLRDANDNIIVDGDLDVSFVTTMGTLGEVTSNEDGTYTVILTSGTVTGEAWVRAVVDGTTYGPGAQVTLIPGPLSAETSTITASPTSITADGVSTSTITVVGLDAHGNRVGSGGEQVAILTSTGTVSPVTDLEDGRYTAVLTSSLVVEEAAVTFTVSDVLGTTTAAVAFTEPVIPVAPTDPVTPTDPTDPVTPTGPVAPTEPTATVDPTTSASSSDPTTGGTTGSNGALSATGTSGIVLLVSVSLALMAVGALLRLRRRSGL